MSVKAPLSQREFVALIATLGAMVAISIDAMLPALPEIAATLTPDAPNRAQLVVTSLVFGMGIGTLLVGPLSDRYGRKPVMMATLLLFALSSVACYFAPTLETLLAARVVQGICAAGPRIVSIAMVRDRFMGRAMAEVMSFVAMVFMLVPAVAPLMGQAVMAVANWKVIFLVYVGFAAVAAIWLGLRQGETLVVADQRSLSPLSLWRDARDLFRHRIVLVSTIAQTLTYAALFSALSSMQGVFEQRFDRAESFPAWFGFIALCSISGSVLNARIVGRIGMRAVVIWTYRGMLVLTLLLLAVRGAGLMPAVLDFPAHLLWSVALFAMMGLSLGNLSALAMEPLGHIAGLAASITTAIATVVSVLMAVPVGLAFDGSEVPMMLGIAAYMVLAILVMRWAGKR